MPIVPPLLLFFEGIFNIFTSSTSTPYLSPTARFKSPFLASRETFKIYFPSPSVVDFSEICGRTMSDQARSLWFFACIGFALESRGETDEAISVPPSSKSDFPGKSDFFPGGTAREDLSLRFAPDSFFLNPPNICEIENGINLFSTFFSLISLGQLFHARPV